MQTPGMKGSAKFTGQLVHSWILLLNIIYVQGRFLNMTVSGDGCADRWRGYLTQVLTTCMQQYTWSEVVVLQGEEAPPGVVKTLSSYSHPDQTSFTWYTLRRRSVSADIEHALNMNVNLRGDPKLFVVTCELSCLREVLKQVNEHDLKYQEQGVFVYKNKWLLVVGSAGELRELAPRAGNITGLTAVLLSPLAVYSAAYKPEGRVFELIASVAARDAAPRLPVDVFPNEKFRFNGRRLRAGVNYWGPFLKLNSDGSRTGLCMELLYGVAQYLNFTFDLIEPPDMLWGSYVDGKFTGITGQFHRKETDLAIVPMVISTVRSIAQDFTQAYYYEPSVLGYRRLGPKSKIDLYIKPFKPIVWLFLVLAIPVTAVLMALFVQASSTVHGAPALPRHPGPKESLARVSLFTLGSFLQQGVTPNIAGPVLCLRFVFGFWWLFCLVVVATFSGNIIAFLTVDIHEPPFTTLDEMIDTQRYILGVPGSTVWEELFQHAASPAYARAWDLILEHERRGLATRDGLSVQVQRIYDMENYAVVMDMTKLEAEMAASCDIAMMRETFFPMQYAVGLQNNSVYNDPISRAIQRFTEEGLIEAWRRKHAPPRLCNEITQSFAKTASLENVQSVFMALGALLGIALLVLVVENAAAHSSGVSWRLLQLRLREWFQ